MASVSRCPTELLSMICSQIYAAALPAHSSTIDPLMPSPSPYYPPTALPSVMPPPHWTEFAARKTLASLCLVNRAWYDAARPWLWRRIEVRLPRSWLALLDEITGGEEDEQSTENTALVVARSIHAVAEAAVASTVSSTDSNNGNENTAALQKWKESILATLSGPDGSVPPEILTPPASRDPSPRRLRAKSKSPARWKIMRCISDAVQDLADRNEFGLYVPAVQDPRPGRFVQLIDFNHFRTIGMRRSVEEGMTSRFVTGERIETLLKEMPNLTAFGATEYMDGALTLSVLNELFLRGSASHIRGQPSRGRGVIVADVNEDDYERRRDCRELEAVDFTGCVSAVFVSALTEFVHTHLLPADDTSGSEDESEHRRDRDERRLRSARAVRFPADEDPLVFPGVRRLCIRGVRSVQPHILNPFVRAFPRLTHLDLSGTRVTPELLSTLAAGAMRLESLSLARCTRLTGDSIITFLVHAPAAAHLRELSLYGDPTFPTPLSAADLDTLFTQAPCMLSGMLTYLDLSSTPVTPAHLLACPPQPALCSLGLSYMPNLDLAAIAWFMVEKAPAVEVLTLIATSPELGGGMGMGMGMGMGAGMGVDVPRGVARQTSLALHMKFIGPLCTSPSASLLGTNVSEAGDVAQSAKTRLRVIELSMPALASLGRGGGSWRIVRSKGGRGWYVDTASGWVGGALVRGLAETHPLRVELNRLADANGNVNSGVGWHSRKMEVLHGLGMMGREDGLYGAVSFAYQG